jgi:hypothetical protein
MSALAAINFFLMGALCGVTLSDWLTMRLVREQRELIEEYRRILGPIPKPSTSEQS